MRVIKTGEAKSRVGRNIPKDFDKKLEEIKQLDLWIDESLTISEEALRRVVNI